MRKVLFWLHLTFGVAAGVVILLMSLTGIALAYRAQLVAFADRGFHSSPGAPLPLAQITAHASEGRRAPLSAISLRRDAGAPLDLSFGRESSVYVDRATGAVLGEGSRVARRFVAASENLHRWLSFPQSSRTASRAVTGASNLVFLAIVLSGAVLWWRTGMLRFRRGLRGRTRDFNWHNVIGIWSWLPLVVIVTSGVFMSYPWATSLLYRLTGETPDAGPSSPPAAALSPSVDRLWARAEAETPDWRRITLRLPQRSEDAVTFSVDRGDGGRPDLRSQLTLDAHTGAVTRNETFSTYGRARRLRTWMRFLHTGEAGGAAGETVAAIATAGATLLVLTGLSMAIRRFAGWRRRRATSP